MAENGNHNNNNNKLNGIKHPENYTNRYNSDEISPLQNQNNKFNQRLTTTIIDDEHPKHHHNNHNVNDDDGDEDKNEIDNPEDQPHGHAENNDKIKLKSSDIKININDDSIDSISEIQDKKSKKIKGKYEAVLTQLDISKKAKIPFIILLSLCMILLLILILLLIFWPTIPYYMKAPECTDKQCLDASKQILVWANISTDACMNPHEWACGNFEKDYIEFTNNGNNDGEWNAKAYRDYEEMYKIHTYFAKIPKTPALLFAPQYKWKELYSTCMNTNVDKKQGDMELKKAIELLTGWNENENYRDTEINFKAALLTIQHTYGIFPYFKISVQKRPNHPFDDIISVTEGEVGLPNRYFYKLNPNHRIIQGYMMLIRDFAINFGLVSDRAKKFAENVFYYEQRFVNAIPNIKQSKIITSFELQRRASLLPIMEIAEQLFPTITMNKHTPILVESLEMLQELSTLISTTDKYSLNDFFMWSLARHFLPFMSQEYVTSLEEFKTILYGHSIAPSKWYFCSRLLKDWMPFAVKVLMKKPELFELTIQPNNNKEMTICKCFVVKNLTSSLSPELIFQNYSYISNNNKDQIEFNDTINEPEQLSANNYDFMNAIKSKSSQLPLLLNTDNEDYYQTQMNNVAEKLIDNDDNYNIDLIKLIFYHIRNQFIQLINDNVKINLEVTDFLIDKLSSTKIIIGIPDEVLQNVTYLNKYYKDFHLQKSNLLENLATYWKFKRLQMIEQLTPHRHETDKIITELFPLNSDYNSDDNYDDLVRYSKNLQSIIISEDVLNNNYFHYKYPISINFARIGFDIAEATLKAMYFYIDQYKVQYYARVPTNMSIPDMPEIFGDTTCFDRKLHNSEIPYKAKMDLYTQILMGRFTMQAHTAFLRKINSNQPIEDAAIGDHITYSLFGLDQMKRQPGLRKLDEQQLFSLAFLQRHCSAINRPYDIYKPFVEHKLSERELFNIILNQIPNISLSMLCSEKSGYCKGYL